jgi:hypothetical protein
MSKPSIPDPAATAQRVKDLARDLASDVSAGYRKSSRFVRLRAAVAGGWLLLSLLALLIAFSSHEPGDRATLADTSVGRVISLKNTTDETWTDVTLTLEGGWTYVERTIRHGEDVLLDIRNFKKDGLPAPAELTPRWIEVECSQFDQRFELSRH